jgi:hypothetical protein
MAGPSDQARGHACSGHDDEDRTCFPNLLSLPADVAEHVRMDVQTDIGDIVKVLAGDQPDDLADLAFGIVAGHASKRARLDLFLFVSSIT